MADFGPEFVTLRTTSTQAATETAPLAGSAWVDAGRGTKLQVAATFLTKANADNACVVNIWVKQGTNYVCAGSQAIAASEVTWNMLTIDDAPAGEVYLTLTEGAGTSPTFTATWVARRMGVDT